MLLCVLGASFWPSFNMMHTLIWKERSWWYKRNRDSTKLTSHQCATVDDGVMIDSRSKDIVRLHAMISRDAKAPVYSSNNTCIWRQKRGLQWASLSAARVWTWKQINLDCVCPGRDGNKGGTRMLQRWNERKKINRKTAEPNSSEENELNRHVRSSTTEIQKRILEICHT
jgi:hypothetical protein